MCAARVRGSAQGASSETRDPQSGKWPVACGSARPSSSVFGAAARPALTPYAAVEAARALEAPDVQKGRNGYSVKDDGIQALWEVKPRASFLADPSMLLEDGAECSDLGFSRMPCEINHDRDGEAAIRPFDGGRRDGGCTVQHALQAVVHAVSIQVGAVKRWSSPISWVAAQANTPTEAAPNAELMAIVVARNVRLVRVCFQDR